MVRRSFLQNTIIGTIGATLFKSHFDGLASNSLSTLNTQSFMVESGVYGKDSSFVLGFLIVDN